MKDKKKGPQIELKCKNCKKIYTISKTYQKHQTKIGRPQKFCSMVCYREFERNKPKPRKRQCIRCKEVKPFTATFFSVRKRVKFGLESVCKKCVSSRALEPNKKYQRELRYQTLYAYSNGLMKCACCSESIYELLTIDHIYGGGGKERRECGNFFYRLRRENFPYGYRVLCYNCNMSRGRYGYCPHRNLPEDKIQEEYDSSLIVANF